MIEHIGSLFKRGRRREYKDREQVNFWVDSAMYAELCAWASENGYSASEVLNSSIACGLPVLMSNPDFIATLKKKFEKESS